MKLIVFILGCLIFTTQVDLYNIEVMDTSIVLEIEDNNSLTEEYTLSNEKTDLKSVEIPSFLKAFKPYIFSFDQIHPDQEIDPPDLLS